MRGVKGTHSPGQYDTSVTQVLRTVRKGGRVRFCGDTYSHPTLAQHQGNQVLVNEYSNGMTSGFHFIADSVGVYEVYWEARWSKRQQKMRPKYFRGNHICDAKLEGL